MTIGDICNREVVFVERQASIQDVAALMRDYHVGDLVVIDEREGRRVPVGIITDRDVVVEVIAKGVDVGSVAAADIMSPELVTAREGDDLLDTVKLMRAKGIRRLPVVDARQALVGIVSVDDLIDLLAEELSDLAGLIAREQRRERERRR